MWIRKSNTAVRLKYLKWMQKCIGSFDIQYCFLIGLMVHFTDVQLRNL